MAAHNSFKQPIPVSIEENLQSPVNGLSLLCQFKNKIGEKKQSSMKKKDESLLNGVLKKLDHWSNCFHSFLFNETAHKACSCSGSQSTCLFKSDVDPQHVYHALDNCHTNVPTCCVEPHIINGYALAHQPFRYYFKILWTPTNETLNVYTHLLPSLYFMYLLHTFNQTIDLYHVWPLLIVTLSAIALTLCSAIAHTFHSRSSYHHCCWFMLDYFGITLYAFSSITAHFFACADLSYYQRIGSFNLPIFMWIGVGGFFCCCYAKTSIDGSTRHRQLKIIANAFGYLYGMIPIGHRLVISTEEDPIMHLHLLQFTFMLLSPITYALDMPQRFWPGKFDIIGHSHQFFHIFCALGCYFDILAIYQEIHSERWQALSNQNYFPPLEAVCLAATGLVMICGLLARRFKIFFEVCHKKELDGLNGIVNAPVCECDNEAVPAVKKHQ